MLLNAVAQEPAKPRVALMASAINADSEKFLDLALVEITKRGGLELVERQDIRKVLGEQELALHQDDAGVAVGRLLRADVVAVLETTPDGKEAGGFAVLDTASGVSYWNQGIDSKSVEDVAGEVVKGLAAALEKRSHAGTLSTVCMLGSRNAEFPRTMDVFCETVAFLLDRQLVANPAVTTLDRRRLEAVISENNLPGVEKKDSLLPSLRLVELDFRQGATTNEVKVLARVTDSTGKVLAQPEVAGPLDAAELANRLQVALAEALHAQPQAAAGNRVDEANRFRAQGKILWDRGLQPQAIIALDAAYALDPGGPEKISSYVDYLMKHADALSNAGEDQKAMDVLRRTLDIEELHNAWHPDAGAGTSDPAINVLTQGKKNIAADSPLRVEFNELRLRYQRALGLTVNSGEAAEVPFRKSPYTGFDGVPVYYPVDCSEHLQFRVSPARVLCLDSTELFRILNARLDAWFQREADLSLPHDAGVVITLNSLCDTACRAVWDSCEWVPFDEAYVRGLRDVARRFTEHPRRVVQLEGLYFSLLIDFDTQTRGGAEVALEDYKQRSGKMVDLALEALAATNQPPPGDMPLLYELAASMVAPFGGSWNADIRQEWRDLNLHRIALAMLDNHHIDGAILRMLEYGEVDFQKYRLPILYRLNAIQHNPSYLWMNLTKRDMREILSVLPAQNPVAQIAPADMRVLWQTPAPEDWRNRMVGLCVKDEKTLYAYKGYQWHYEVTQNPELDILNVDLASGRMETIGHIQVDACWPEHFYNLSAHYCEGEFIEDAAVSETHLWLASFGGGLWGIPLAGGGKPIHLGMADGLPSDTIHSVTVVDGALYIGCGQQGSEGYLVRYDPATKACKVIVSTLRASPENGLDALKDGFHLQKIMHDAPRNRLLLVVNIGVYQSAVGQLWEYRLDDGSFRSLLEMDTPARAVEVAADGKLQLDLNSSLWNLNGWYGVVEFDPAADSGRLVFSNQNHGSGAILPLDPGTCIVRDILFKSTALGDGWLYHFGKKLENGAVMIVLRRVSLATREVQPVPGLATVPENIFSGMSGLDSNYFYWGWLKWLPQSRVLLIGNGGQFIAVKVGD